MATKAGSMHRPVGSNNRIDSFAADCSIRDRSSQSSCSIAVANRFTGEEPLDHDEENASRTTAQSSSSGHASFHGMPLFSRSPAERNPPPNSPSTMFPTVINARGMDTPWRIATLNISNIKGNGRSHDRTAPESGGFLAGDHSYSHVAPAAPTAASIGHAKLIAHAPAASACESNTSRRHNSSRRSRGTSILSRLPQ